MAAATNNSKSVSAKVFGCLSLVFGVVLVLGGVAGWTMGSTVVNQVNQGLVDEKIYFPPEGTPSFSPEAFPDAQAYAGQQVVDGPMSKVYAEDFLDVQSEIVGNGKVLSEVATDLAMDPTNPQLQMQYNLMFEIETSKTLMLVASYGTWAQADMMKKAGLGSLVFGGVLLLVGVMQLVRARRA